MSKNPTARTARNAAASYLRFFVSMMVMFLLTPYIIRHVGQQEFGLWSLTFSVLGFFGLLDMGLSSSVVRYVAECRGAGDIDRRNRMVSTLSIVYLVITTVAAIAVLALSHNYTRLFSIPLEQQSRAVALLWILAARTSLFALPLSLFQGILFGEQRIALLNGIQISTTLLYGSLSWVALAHGSGLVTLAWINLGAMILEYTLYAVFAFRTVGDLRISWKLADRSLLRTVAGFSFAQSIVSVAALVRLRTDPLIVQYFLPISQVAIYAVALRIAESALLLIKQGINVLSPLMAQLHGSGDHDKIRTTMLGAGKLSFFGSTLLTVPICVFATQIVSRWVGTGFASAGPTLIVLMLSMWLVTPQLVAASVLAMTGHHKITARAEVGGMLLNLCVSIALARPLGLAGVALGTLVSTIIVDLLYIVSYACRVNGITYGTFTKKVLLAGFVPGAVQTAITLAIKLTLPALSIPVMLLGSVAGGAAALAVFYTLYLEPDEKRAVLKRLRRGKETDVTAVAVSG